MPDRATTALMMWAARSSGRTDANAPACRPTGVRRAVMIAARLCIEISTGTMCPSLAARLRAEEPARGPQPDDPFCTSGHMSLVTCHILERGADQNGLFPIPVRAAGRANHERFVAGNSYGGRLPGKIGSHKQDIHLRGLSIGIGR